MLDKFAVLGPENITTERIWIADCDVRADIHAEVSLLPLWRLRLGFGSYIRIAHIARQILRPIGAQATLLLFFFGSRQLNNPAGASKSTAIPVCGGGRAP